MPDPADRSSPASTTTPPPGLTVRTATNDGTFAVTVVGEIDVASIDSFREAAAAAADSAAAQVVVDLAGCSFIDSSGLLVLVVLRQALVQDDRTLLVTPGPLQVQRVFDIAGLTPHFFPAAPGATDGQVVKSPPSTGSNTPVT
jgi:anti-anti-sigma factor